MSSPKRIKFLIAMILAASSLAFLLATYSTGDANAESQFSAPRLKSRILRPKHQLGLDLDASELAALRQGAVPQEERVFENKIPQHLPIKVKIRAEKEKAAKDLDNDRWHRDLEIEVKNTGDKPIYYLSIILEMQDIKIGEGFLTLGVRYGKHTLFDGSKGQAELEDVPLKPKETIILKLDEGQARGWEIWQTRERAPRPKKILFLFEELNFGDGTGFFGGNGAPWPMPNRARPVSDAGSRGRRGHEDFRSHHPRISSRNPRALNALNGGESASFWPTTFRLPQELTYLLTYNYQAESAASTEGCCPGGCRLIDIVDDQFCYYCPILRRAVGVHCIYEPEEGICASVQHDSKVCSDGNSCPFDITNPCGSTASSPTPTPTPTPTDEPPPSPTPTPTAPPCDPAKKPNNTNCYCDTIPYIITGAPPQWSCPCSGGTGANYVNFGSNLGCEPNKYNNGNDCCICISQTCPGGGSPNPYTCQCPTPTPTPTAPPNNGGGGGGGTEGGDEWCTEYWWEYFQYYDGGRHEVGREYAGCW